jgi:hypothetical protein
VVAEVSEAVRTLALVTLSFARTLDRTTFLVAVECVADLVTRPEVGSRWEDESACAGMTVGGLTHHLASQAINACVLIERRDLAPAEAETIAILEHYRRAAWVNESLAAEANTSIRDSANELASMGRGALIDRFESARADLPGILVDPAKVTYIPWQGWSMATDDFLVTRLMEMVVHSDDLAASVDVPAPDFGPEVLDPVLRLLTALALRRHGQDAVVRALARPQRAPSTIAAF